MAPVPGVPRAPVPVSTLALASIRAAAATIAASAVALLVAITLGLAASFGLELTRFRELTWALWGALAVFALARREPGAYLRRSAERIRAALEARSFFPWMAALSLALYAAVSLNLHHSFHTFSHDFSMFDETLYESSRGRFLYSPVLGRSFLTEHFSPILALLIPLHALVPSPYLLVLGHALLLWAAVLPLRGILDTLGVPPAARHVACAVYLAHPVTVSALQYGFHVESFLPLIVLGAYLAHRRGRSWVYAALLVLALAIKEDVGLYLTGLGAFLILAERRPLRGAFTALLGIGWVLAYLAWVSPALHGASEYRFLSRWEHWGTGLAGVAAGMLTHPVAVALALAAPTYLLFFYRLVFTPFWSRWGWALVAIPWALQATAGLRQQNTLGLYYGVPLLAFSAIAAAHGLASGAGKRILASPVAPALAALAVVLNVAHFAFHRVPREREELLAALRRLPATATIQAMPTVYPVLEYERPKRVLMPGDSLSAEVVVLRVEETVWPFSREELARLEEAAARTRYEEVFRQGTFRILRRGSAPGDGP